MNDPVDYSSKIHSAESARQFADDVSHCYEHDKKIPITDKLSVRRFKTQFESSISAASFFDE